MAAAEPERCVYLINCRLFSTFHPTFFCASCFSSSYNQNTASFVDVFFTGKFFIRFDNRTQYTKKCVRELETCVSAFENKYKYLLSKMKENGDAVCEFSKAPNKIYLCSVVALCCVGCRVLCLLLYFFPESSSVYLFKHLQRYKLLKKAVSKERTLQAKAVFKENSF